MSPRPTEENGKPKLTPEQRAKVFQLLDEKAGQSGLFRRLIRLVAPPSERDAPLALADWRFGAGSFLVGIFFLLVCLALPHDGYRWMFFAMGWCVVLVGAWFVDRAKRKLHRNALQKKQTD